MASTFRIAQFNILGRQMAGSMWFHYARDYLPRGLAYNPAAANWRRDGGFPRNLLWNKNDGPGSFYRFPTLLSEMQKTDADILCLVELDCYAEFQKALGDIGYDSTFAKRPGKMDGCGIFWRRDAFAAAGKPQTKVYEVPADDRIALAQPLRHKDTGNPVLVVSTHLYWDQKAGHQLAESRELLDWVSQLGEGGVPGAKAMLLCGDLNALPESEAYRLLTSTLKDVVPEYKPGSFTSLKPDVYYWAKPAGQRQERKVSGEWHYQRGRGTVIDYILADRDAFSVAHAPELPCLSAEGSVGHCDGVAPGFWSGGWAFDPLAAESHEENRFDPKWAPARRKGELQLGIPNRIHASDHIPVACTLRFRSHGS